MTVPGIVGVLGGGRMGAGIAHAFLLAGSDVTIVERDSEAAAAAHARVAESLDRTAERGALPRPRGELDLSFVTAVDADAFGAATMVIEAVPEDRGLKLEALARAEQAVPADAVLASNTSSISIDDLAETLERPEQFLGLHFFNPVPSSKLVEIVRGRQTDAEVITRARSWIAALGKTAIVVQDAPEFASSRERV